MGIFARTKSLALVYLFVVMGACGAFVFVSWSIVRTNAASVQLSASIQEQATKDEQLRGQQRLLEEIAQEDASLSTRFVAAEGVVDFIKLIETTAKFAKVSAEIASVDINQNENAAASYEWLNITFKAEGTWQQLFHFVHLVETIPYAVKLDQIGLRREQAENTPVAKQRWEGVFVLRVAKSKP